MIETHLIPSNRKRLLILDDDALFLKTLDLEFGDLGYAVFAAEDLAHCKEVLSLGEIFDFALLDMRLKSTFGFPIIEDILRVNPLCRVVMLTGYPTTATTVRAMRLGTVNCLLKPSSIELIEQAMWLENIDNEFDFSVSDESSLSLAQYEHEFIEFILAQSNWNITRAAKRLGLHRQSLQRKLRKNPDRKIDPSYFLG